METLGKFPNLQVIQSLVALLKSSDKYVRKALVQVLGESKSPHTVSILKPLLADPIAYVRSDATRILKKLKAF